MCQLRNECTIVSVRNVLALAMKCIYLHSGESHHACTCHLLSIEQWTIGTGSPTLDTRYSGYQRGWQRVNSLSLYTIMHGYRLLHTSRLRRYLGLEPSWLTHTHTSYVMGNSGNVNPSQSDIMHEENGSSILSKHTSWMLLLFHKSLSWPWNVIMTFQRYFNNWFSFPEHVNI